MLNFISSIPIKCKYKSWEERFSETLMEA